MLSTILLGLGAMLGAGIVLFVTILWVAKALLPAFEQPDTEDMNLPPGMDPNDAVALEETLHDYD